MKILVTGGLGFIGSNFCRYAVAKRPNYEIINVDKKGIGANPFSLKELRKQERYEFIRGNICNSKLIAKIIKKVDAVVNIAAETHVDRSIADPELFIQNNVMGTFTIIEAIRKHNDKIKFVQVSTDEVYGEIKEGSLKENAMLRPSNPYSASKAAADMLAIAYQKTYGLNASITRCTNNYGPYQTPEKLVPKTVIRALKNLSIPVYGSGESVRDWIYVEDHCEAVDFVLREGEKGEIYNISTGNEISTLNIVKKILHMLNKPEDLIAFVEDRPGHDSRYSLNSARIESELGWKPKIPFEDGLKRTVNWYLNNKWWWKPIATERILYSTPWKLSDVQ